MINREKPNGPNLNRTNKYIVRILIDNDYNKIWNIPFWL